MKTTQCTQLPPEDLFGAVKQLLQEGYHATFTVTGNSMWPCFAHGRDQVTLQAPGDQPVKAGDILLFSPEPGRYLLHRVIQVRGSMFRTAGDNNCYCDGIFPKTCIIGRVVEFSRKSHPVNCQNTFYRLYCHIWVWLFPVRQPLLRLFRAAARQAHRCL